MIRFAIAVSVLLGAMPVLAQSVLPPAPEGEGVSAADYIQQQLDQPENPNAPNIKPSTAPPASVGDTFQNPSIYDGRREQTLTGTGLNVVPQRRLRDWHP